MSEGISGIVRVSSAGRTYGRKNIYVYFTTKVDMTENIKYSIKYKNKCKPQTTRQRREIKTIETVIETYHTRYEITNYHIY